MIAGCCGRIYRTTACIRMAQGTKSWRRWRRRQLRILWPASRDETLKTMKSHRDLKKHLQIVSVITFALAVPAAAQQPAPAPTVTPAPALAPAQAPAPSIPTTGFAGLDQYRASRIA